MMAGDAESRFLELWERFGCVPVNDDCEIGEPFEGFPAGTPMEDVWRWFEDEFDFVSVGFLLETGQLLEGEK